MLNSEVSRLQREEIIDGYGHLEIEPGGPLAADSWCEYVISYTVPRPIAKGGSLRVTIPHLFTTPQIDDPALPGYVCVETTPPTACSIEIDVRYTCVFYENGHTGKYGKNIFVRFDEAVPEGSRLELTYGSMSHGAMGARAPYFGCVVYFLAAIDPTGGRGAPLTGYRLLAEQLGVEIVGKKATAARIVIPSVANVGEMTGALLMVDAKGSVDRSFEGEVGLFTETPGVEVERSVRFRAGDRGVKTFHIKNPAGKACVVETSWDGGYGASNPCVPPRADGMRVFWGDYHVHTYASDGLGTARESFAHARDNARLDFAAVTDHEGFTKEQLDYMRAAADEVYAPGRFAPLFGFEFTVHELPNDYCLISPDPDLNIDELISHPVRHKAYSSPVLTCDEFYRMMERKDLIIIPHLHVGNGGIFEREPPKNLRLAEIYSCWGNHEYEGCPLPSFGNDHKRNTIRALLDKGWRCGFTAGSDGHAGQGATTDWLRSRQRYKSGLTAVVAEDLTRESLWEALRARRTYATTGVRIYMDFSVNGFPMGSELILRKGDPITIRIKTHGSVNDYLVELFENGVVKEIFDVITYPYPPPLGGNGIIEKELTIENVTDSHWYYIRVSQRDGNLAWSSPIWVDIPSC